MGIITSRPEAQQEKASKNLKHVKLPIFYILPFGQGTYVLSERLLLLVRLSLSVKLADIGKFGSVKRNIPTGASSLLLWGYVWI